MKPAIDMDAEKREIARLRKRIVRHELRVLATQIQFLDEYIALHFESPERERLHNVVRGLSIQ